MAIPGSANTPGTNVPGFPDYTDPAQYATYFNTKLNHGKPLGSLPDPVTGANITGSTLGAQWLTWYAADNQAHPGNTVQQYAEGFLVLWEESQLGTNLAAGLGGGAAAVGALAQSATVTAAQEAGAIFSVFQSGNLWLRIGEGLLGIVLIAVGVARLTHAVPIATKIARTVA